MKDNAESRALESSVNFDQVLDIASSGEAGTQDSISTA